MEHEKQDGTVLSATESNGRSPPRSPEHSVETLINPSGHKQELERNFSLLSLCAVAITTGNTWVAIGGSVVSHVREEMGYLRLTESGCRHLQWRASRCPV